MQKRMNWSLWIGAFLVLLLLIVGVIGPYVAPYELDFQEKLRNEVVGGKTVIISPPLPRQMNMLSGRTSGATTC